MTNAPIAKPLLNQGQQNGADLFFEFLHSDGDVFAISGTAGTGKTFLMSVLHTRIMEEYRSSCRLLGQVPRYTDAVFTATTNKAAEVLSEAINQSVKTIHSFLGLKVKEDYKTGKTFLQETQNTTPKSGLIVFIDECSMIDRELLMWIRKLLKGCKLVFVGDHAQMAPVGEDRSELYNGLDKSTLVVLTEPVRNAGQPALVQLCAQLRETVETGIFKPIEPVDGAIYYLTDEEMVSGLHHVFQDLDPSSRILCYTNSRVQAFNGYIREEVRHRPAKPMPGDIMVVAQAYASGKTNLSVESEMEIVETSEPRQFSIANEVFVWGWSLTIRRPGSQGEGISVDVTSEPHIVSEELKSLSRRKRWGEFFDLKAKFADLRPKDACTVYKAQGSTYDTVFVDLGNIGTSHDAGQVARMLFVAISRARSTVYLHGQLHGRYHNSKGVPLWTAESSAPTSSTPSSIEQPNSSMQRSTA